MMMAETTHLTAGDGSNAPHLIVGLGNPGRKYRWNRHNIGFRCLDRLADRLGVSFTRLQSGAFVTDSRHHGQRVYLAKPQTYMNGSGQPVRSLVDYYRIPLERLLVVYDDLDLPLGALRMRPEGGSGGHNGMRSILQHLGDPGFPRLRIGVDRPPGRMDPADYLLQDFSSQEEEHIEPAMERAVEATLTYLEEGIEQAMTRYNRTEEPAGSETDDRDG